MEIVGNLEGRVILSIFRGFSRRWTISSLSEKLGNSRVGVWKAVKKLEKEKFVLVEKIGSGKTSMTLVTLNFGNILVEKLISYYLTKFAVKRKRWLVNFSELESECEFLILFGSVLHSYKKASDIDLVVVAKKGKFLKVQSVLDAAQMTLDKRIHAIKFTENEFQYELLKPNKAFIESVDKGVILFGQDKFVQFMKKVTING